MLDESSTRTKYEQRHLSTLNRYRISFFFFAFLFLNEHVVFLFQIRCSKNDVSPSYDQANRYDPQSLATRIGQTTAAVTQAHTRPEIKHYYDPLIPPRGKSSIEIIIYCLHHYSVTAVVTRRTSLTCTVSTTLPIIAYRPRVRRQEVCRFVMALLCDCSRAGHLRVSFPQTICADDDAGRNEEFPNFHRYLL